MTAWKNVLTIVLMMGSFSHVLATYTDFLAEFAQFTTDPKNAEGYLANWLGLKPGPKYGGELKITDYCVLSSPQLLEVCKFALQELVYPSNLSIVDEMDKKYVCEHVRISWTTPEYNKKYRGVILPLIKCPELSSTSKRGRYEDPLRGLKMKQKQDSGRYYVLGFAKKFETLMFVSKSDNEKSKTESWVKSNDSIREKNRLRTPLLKDKRNESSNDIKYSAAYNTIYNEQKQVISTISIKSEYVEEGVYEDFMIYPTAVVQFNSDILSDIISMEEEAATKDQVGSSSSVKLEND